MLILLQQVAEKQVAEDLGDRHHELVMLCVSEMPLGLDEGIRRLAWKPSIRDCLRSPLSAALKRPLGYLLSQSDLDTSMS